MPDSMSVAAGSKVRRLALCIGAAALMLTACGKKTPADPPRADVSTATVAPQAATVFTDYVAQTEAVNTVEIRPRVGGVLEKQLPIEGERVKIGALLFVIDQQPYIAALAQAKAALAQSEAALVQSQRDLARAKSLSEIDAVSQQELDAAVAKNDANLASVDAGRALVRTAQLNLGYTTITSPINGVMGRAQLRLGGLVTANSTVLTTLYETDRMYVNFSISEQRLLTLQRQAGRAPNQNSATPPPFRIFLADGSEYPQRPRLNFIDPAVDQRTGTLAIRLEVENPEHLLHAGQFARVQVAATQLTDAIVLPQRAIQELQGKYYVWIVDAEGKAQQRDVQMGPRIGSGWQVQQGLKAGDVVVVDGVQRLKPGAAVNATPLANVPEATGKAAGSRT
ncbi:MAG: efflux RND transporter periplasmic adaptor subunit [Gammaproteobacteria bacterium]|nr:MAG: efflux RND transporter periplasmic adaptor subunit [Gammaproteobacteria bacterium]